MDLVPEPADLLLGADFAAVRERFGAPDCCRRRDGELHFTYRLPDGRSCDDAVVVSDGVVTHVDRELRPDAGSRGRDGIVGCSVEDVMMRFGNPSSAVSLRDAMELRFDDVVLLVVEGLVVAATKPFHAAS